jgi:hypothetical protein
MSASKGDIGRRGWSEKAVEFVTISWVSQPTLVLSNVVAQINGGKPARQAFARQQSLETGAGDLFGYHGIKWAEFARDDGAQILAQPRGLPAAIHTLETLLRLRPAFLSALETRVAGLGQP